MRRDGPRDTRPDGTDPTIVLVVDDSPDTLRMLTDAIEMTGATVLVALGGEDALGVASRLTPDIVLMDAAMPGMSGFEATRRLKADPALAHIPVIFMTGLTETSHVVEGLESGAVDYLTKPIVPDELIARVRVHLANARQTASAREALDTTGRFLFAADGAGTILWCTPQARRLLTGALAAADDADRETSHAALSFPAGLVQALRRDAGATRPLPGEPPAGTGSLMLSFLGTMGENEHLFRVIAEGVGDPKGVLVRRFGVTEREGDVCLWLSRGKANRDIAEILDLSPRTVNKHLQAIFAKLGVENRASAAVLIHKALRESE